MKKLSFKIITTFWITFLVAVVCGLSITSIILMGRSSADEKLRQTLTSAIDGNSDEMEYSNGIFEIENDFIYYSGGIYCDLFSENGEYIAGETPHALIESPTANSVTVTETELDGQPYYVCCKLLEFTKFEYEIDVFSGQVISYEADVTPKNELTQVPYSVTRFEGGIDSERAVEIALEHAGIDKADARIIAVEIPASNDRQVFRIDFTSEKSPYDEVYIRAICPSDKVVSAFDAVGKSALYLLPFFVIAAALGAYIISAKTIRPVEKITASAHEISSGSDLTKRLDTDKAPHEIHNLADTFNEMFERLQTAFENEKRFTSDASHELRTPLAVIKAECEYALSSNADGDDRLEALESIHAQADKMASLVSSLLAVTRAEQGTKNFALEKGNLSTLTEDICNKYKPSKNITLTTDIEKDIEININASLMTQLIENLISNADKYGRENGEIKVRLFRDGNSVKLSVRDNGIGISKEDLPEIWGRFYRADRSRSQTEGFGLGLALVKKIAEIHSAECKAESEYDKFTEISVIFKKL